MQMRLRGVEQSMEMQTMKEIKLGGNGADNTLGGELL